MVRYGLPVVTSARFGTIAAIAAATILAGGCVLSDSDVDNQAEQVPAAPLDSALDSADSPTPPTTTASTTTAAPTTVAPSQVEALLSAIATVESPVALPRVGLVAHRASVHSEGRTIDLIAQDDGMELTAVFAPEHGLAGTADAGELVDDGLEPVTGVPVFSLYGERREPTADELAELDVLVYDLQDVGVRAYTYIATMGLVFDAAAEAGIPVVVVDRPNPQGAVVDGPILAEGLESFVSPYPIPPAYGLSSGELARMLKGEGWVDSSIDLHVVGPAAPLADPWIPPSPNLPTLETTWLYPAVVALEATTLSVGRGTTEPFTLIGGPGVDGEVVARSASDRQLLGLDVLPAAFTPMTIPEMSENPKYSGIEINGINLSTSEPLPEPIRVTVELMDAFMDAAPVRADVIDQPAGFDRLVGDPEVRQALLADTDPAVIAAEWADDVVDFVRRASTYRS